MKGHEINLGSINFSDIVACFRKLMSKPSSYIIVKFILFQSMTKYYLLINATSENYVTNITGVNATALEDNATQIKNTENISELLNQLSSNTTYNDDNGVGLHYILGVATLLVSVMTVIGNGSLLWVILKTSLLRTVTNSFIVSLAISDLIVGFLIMPYCAGMSVDIE